VIITGRRNQGKGILRERGKREREREREKEKDRSAGLVRVSATLGGQ